MVPELEPWILTHSHRTLILNLLDYGPRRYEETQKCPEGGFLDILYKFYISKICYSNSLLKEDILLESRNFS